MRDTTRRGILESIVARSGFWAVRFADKSFNVRVSELKMLPSDDASFELSQAPLSSKEKRRARSFAPLDAAQTTRKRHRALPESTVIEGTAGSDSDCDDSPVCLEVLNAATALLDCTHVLRDVPR